MVKREDFHWCVYIYPLCQRVFYRDPLTLDSQIPGAPGIDEWRTVSVYSFRSSAHLTVFFWTSVAGLDIDPLCFTVMQIFSVFRVFSR